MLCHPERRTEEHSELGPSSAERLFRVRGGDLNGQSGWVRDCKRSAAAVSRVTPLPGDRGQPRRSRQVNVLGGAFALVRAAMRDRDPAMGR
jgi:hypothetical protein